MRWFTMPIPHLPWQKRGIKPDLQPIHGLLQGTMVIIWNHITTQQSDKLYTQKDLGRHTLQVNWPWDGMTEACYSCLWKGLNMLLVNCVNLYQHANHIYNESTYLELLYAKISNSPCTLHMYTLKNPLPSYLFAYIQNKSRYSTNNNVCTYIAR